METRDTEILLGLIRYAVWNTEMKEAVDWPIYEEMKRQAIATLPAGILNKIEMNSALRQTWKMTNYQQIAYNVNYSRLQAQLPITVPFVILKGTAAAKYYPDPRLRNMGDIDIMPRREDFDTAYRQFLEQGYQIEKNFERETGFVKDGVMVELHRSFAKLNDPAYAAYLDDLIIANINETHELPDAVNGLVLLEHISQHLANGLGLRQIIDWMLFVDQCLPDAAWPAFETLTEKIGLKTLAVVTTRMCEMYLGLPDRAWCAGADEGICRQLMDYVLESGNFGSKRVDDQSVSENVFVYARNPIATFKLLQKKRNEKLDARPALRVGQALCLAVSGGAICKKGFIAAACGGSAENGACECQKKKGNAGCAGCASGFQGPCGV